MTLSPLKTEFVGDKGAVFRLALKTGLLTVVTLGFYRFWMKTRLRRYYWSAVRPGGAPFEYLGQPLEKLLGFLVAVVFMAFYIGVVNLLLMFVSFSLFQGNFVAYGLSFVGILPIIFFAQYRARRYVLARTRWRGIRFGLEPGAWGYAWRAALYWTLTILTAGLLWPLKAFALEKYRTDRTYFGSLRLHQGGRWTMLLRAMRPLYTAAGLSILGAVMLYLSENPAWMLVFLLSVPWGIYGLAFWRADSFRRLSETKELGGARLTSAPRAGRVVGIYAGGYGLIYLCISGVLMAALALVAIIAALGVSMNPDAILNGDFSSIPGWVATMIGVLTYFTVFVLWDVFHHAFVKVPMVEHFAIETALVDAQNLSDVHQRDRDEFAEAEGFADALDVGAAL
ncbi:DUF898 domain-containing protein [Aliiroseovarius subalbicans]|uniref:DUF898 domain-containing protein n=1 Tax=Aliiroseovarius subalbicans TaxID=2925840 RepID=UPI001F58459B|nr:DUF898 domain-containing protein [Aliiroseovarius subalbicans]MCI2399695.1 DUF898 domain-containing protein [Aliiroseovarius subalbicans]